MTNLIHASDWSVYRGDHPLIQNIQLQVNEGEWHHIMGHNNVGKSLILECFSGNYQNCRGQLKVLEYNMLPISSLDLAHVRKRMGYASQRVQLLENKTVRINLLMCLQAAERVFEQSNDFIINSLLEEFELSQLLKREVNTLSYSEKQIISLLRAIIHKPKLLLLDQCFDQLDQEISVRFIEKIENLLKTDRIGVVSTSWNEIEPGWNATKWKIQNSQMVAY